jgi:hypothetical protein
MNGEQKPEEFMVRSQCETCSAWTVGELTYEELCRKWHLLVGGAITAGYARRYRREGERLGRPWEEVVLPFKYCAKGMLTRFYIVKGPDDTKPRKMVRNCPEYSINGVNIVEFPVPSPLWTICQQEPHKITKVKGQLFLPGLCENYTYFRIPAHGRVEPEIIDNGTCDICGRDFARGLVVREITYFCCNKHYLQWWRKEHPEEYRRFNRRDPEEDKGNPS